MSAEFGSKSTNQKRSPVSYEVCIFLNEPIRKGFPNFGPFCVGIFYFLQVSLFLFIFFFIENYKNGESRDRRIKSPISGMSDIGD